MPDCIEQLLKRSTALLHEQDQPQLEAEVLLAHTLKKPRSYLYAWPERVPDQKYRHRFEQLVRQRIAGKPVAYLTGTREFWSLQLNVNEATLIPRPETELLVEQALKLLPRDQPLRVADLGTGSGAIALALAHERPAWTLYATDWSISALEVTRGNAARLKLANLLLCNCNWCDSFGKQVLDAIVSNPPYIADQDPHLLRGDVRSEPRSALTAGPQGMDDLKQLIEQAPGALKTGGWLLLEHAAEQAEDVRKLLAAKDFSNIQTHRDLAGLERISLGCTQS